MKVVELGWMEGRGLVECHPRSGPGECELENLVLGGCTSMSRHLWGPGEQKQAGGN